MSMFTLAISCLTTSNLPWFMDLAFQVPMQYWSLQHWILLLSLVTSTTGYCFCLYVHIWCHCCCLATKSCLTLCDPWTIAHQALLSIGFPRQEYWRRLPFPSPGDLPDSGIEPESSALVGRFFATKPPGKPLYIYESLNCWPLNFPFPAFVLSSSYGC